LKRLTLRWRLVLTLIGVGLAIGGALLAGHAGETSSKGGVMLYEATVVAFMIAAASFLADALAVTPAIFEILFGLLIAVRGMHGDNLLGLLSLAGSVFLMYIAGLEIDPTLLRREFKSGFLIGGASVVVPLVAVYTVLYWTGYTGMQALLTGLGVSTTGVAIVYSIIKSIGLLRRRIGQLIFSSAMIADVIVVLSFTFIVSSKNLSLLLYFAFVLVFPVLFAKAIDWLPHSSAEAELRIIIAALIGASLLSEHVGIHAVLFAFILGIATRGFIEKRRLLEAKISGLTFGFLAPVFFVYAGMNAMPSGVGSSLKTALLLFVMSYTLKVAASYMGLKILTGVGDLRLASVFGARLTMSTVIAFTGQAAGILSPTLAGAIILSALLATITTAVLTRTAVTNEV